MLTVCVHAWHTFLDCLLKCSTGKPLLLPHVMAVMLLAAKKDEVVEKLVADTWLDLLQSHRWGGCGVKGERWRAKATSAAWVGDHDSGGGGGSGGDGGDGFDMYTTSRSQLRQEALV